eukprot:CAMPEP_0183469870 /NCGR_PEP_ID=MMETSP0370-20130417/155267_1 /TAXON_ID=268820 /ORGANISM="Peridinium aciculiferum, Strain PAER-2" /LENGTH=98 /DNA_ID=CAMNT_0025662359 /DNA_START=1 /DNA_END=294 /DNA_ORIENTATION=+
MGRMVSIAKEVEVLRDRVAGGEAQLRRLNRSFQRALASSLTTQESGEACDVGREKRELGSRGQDEQMAISEDEARKPKPQQLSICDGCAQSEIRWTEL